MTSGRAANSSSRFDEDRVAGVLIATAAGDALGAGYEFEQPPFHQIGMIGGGLGPFAPGEWTDDTSMAVCIAQVTATGSVDATAISERFLEWYRSDPPDMGHATRAVLGDASRGTPMHTAAQQHLGRHRRGGAGNGALMRTAPVALAHLGDDAGLARSARSVAELTHADPLAGDACVLWCIAIDRAVREHRLDGVHDGLAWIPTARRDAWQGHLEHAQTQDLSHFTPNGFTVTALQAAYGAIHQTPVPPDEPERHLRDALEAAVQIGDDTDTVAAIAGALLGGYWGAQAVPRSWREILHGWPGLGVEDLRTLAIATVESAPLLRE